MRTRVRAFVLASLLVAVTGASAVAASRSIPQRPAAGVAITEDQGASLSGDRAALEKALAAPGPIKYKVLVVDDVTDGEDRTSYLDRVASEWSQPGADTLLLVVFTRANNDIRFFMGTDFRKAGIGVDEMLQLVRTVYQPRARTGNAAGALADLIGRVNARFPGVPTAAAAEDKDARETREIVVRYYNAVVNQDRATIDYLWHTSTATTAPAPTETKEARFEQLRLDHIGMEDGVPTAFYTVRVDLGAEPGGAWDPGVNTRWGVLQKKNGVWKINAMATSPHPYAK